MTDKKIPGAFGHTPIWVLILALVMLWPFGIYLMIKRAITEKTYRLSTGLLFVGCALTVLGFCAAALSGNLSRALHTGGELGMNLTGLLTFVLIGIAFLIPGCFLLCRKYRDTQLLRLIVQEKITDMADLQLLLYEKPEKISARITRLQKEGQLPGDLSD